MRLLESIEPSQRCYTPRLTRKPSNELRYFRKLSKIMGCSSSTFQINKPISSQIDDFVEGVVCQVTDLNENEPKTFDLDEKKVLLIKQNGKISALGTKCTHYGAPLASSAVGDGRLRCQWHGACFNIATGDIEDFPGLDSLPCYQVTIEDNNVKVRARKSELESNKRIRNMVSRNKCDTQHIVVIGGGPSGAICVETLRQEGFCGQITLVCAEKYLPYDRIKVTKVMDMPIEKLQFRDPDFYQKYDIKVLTNTKATGVDIENRKVSLSNGCPLNYDKLYIATGAKPRKLNIPGADLKNVIVLREYDDAAYTQSQLSDQKEVAILGSSFIAMEAACFLSSKVKKVTVVLREDVPFKASLGPEIGSAFKKVFEEKGVHFAINSGMKSIIGDDCGNVKEVELNDGTIIKADLVIMGVGSTFNTDFLKDSGLQMLNDGTIEVDQYLQTNKENIFVGGDIAYAPVWCRHNKKASIGHFGLAHYHGKIAALNMLGKQKELQTVPFFWTVLYGKSVRYAGHGLYDEILYSGNVDELKFAAYYLKGDEVVAISSCQMDPIVSEYAERLAQGKQLYRDDIKADMMAWRQRK
ncbi:unnamed protein product [Acanthoscelides obtectus]|nr:unnamed protein product [Acanthoscelides obtectus]CAK1660637.1 Apoptosis-inducing factor 3 [Acanthoscelides obtectus]